MKLHRALAIASLLVATCGAAAPPPAIMSTVDGVIAAANANDISRLNSFFTQDAVLIDEFAPFVWKGPNAGARWWGELDAMNAASHISNVHIAVQQVTQSNVTRGHAYVVLHLVITWRDHGKPWRESGLWALTLHTGSASWKIATASWATGSVISEL